MIGQPQKKRKMGNPQAPILEGSDCQDPFGGRDPYDESIKLLATASDDEPIDGGSKEDSDAISAQQS